jgi:sulfate permease, SulP family
MGPKNGRDALGDGMAALALAAIVIPEQLATAKLAGVPPALGLIVFAAASLGFFLFGANRYLSNGADTTIAPIFAGVIASFAAIGSAHYLALTTALALMVGVAVALAALLRLGWIARLLSVPIVTGFLAGIAIHILISQLPALLGLPGVGGDVFDQIVAITRALPHFNPFALVIGIFVCGVTLAGEKIDARYPAPLVAVVLAALVPALLGWHVALLGHVAPPSFAPALPAVSWSDLGRLVPVALIVALVVMIQTATVSRAFADNAPNINRDLLGVGLGSVLSGAMGGFPANASPPCSAIVKESGGRSRMAGFFAVVIVAIFLLFGLGLLAHVPDAALAGLLLFVAQRIFRTADMRQIFAQTRAEFVLLIVTAAAIVLTPIEIGVGIGIALSLLHGVWTITQTRAVIFELIPGTTVWWPKYPGFSGETRPGLVVVGFQAPLFFLNAETFHATLNHAVKQAAQPVKAIVLEASSVVELDFSGAQTLRDVILHWKDQGVVFYIARLESLRALRALANFGILPLIAHGETYTSVADAVRQFDADFPAD